MHNVGAAEPSFARDTVRTSVLGFGLALLIMGYAAPASAQWLVTDARRIGMGGLTLGRSGNMVRYNAAYRAVPARTGGWGEPKVTIPIPLGIIQFLHDHPNISNDPAFKPGSVGFNPVLAVNTLLNLPLYYEVKKAPTPANNVFVGVGKDSLRINLGQFAAVVPQDAFGIGGSSRVLDPGIDIKGVRVSVMGWLHDDVELLLRDTLLGFLADSIPAQHSAPYTVSVNGLLQGGFAPSIGYAGRITGDSAEGFYVGGAVHYYIGVAYFRTDGIAGFTTSNPLFGATITWPDTRLDSAFYRDSTVAQNGPRVGYSRPVALHVETTTKLPVSYIANIAYTVGAVTLGADVLNAGRGTVVHVGGEQRLGPWAVRGGIARDQRKRLEFGWGGGVRLGGVGFDLGFWTHTNSLSNTRAITMATSVSIY